MDDNAEILPFDDLEADALRSALAYINELESDISRLSDEIKALQAENRQLKRLHRSDGHA